MTRPPLSLPRAEAASSGAPLVLAHEIDEQVKSELAALGSAAREKGMDGIFTSDQAAFSDLAQTPQEMQKLIVKMINQPGLITHLEGYKY